MATNLAELFVKVSADIGDLERKMTAAQRAVSQTGERMAALGKQMTLYVTAPLTALGALSLKAAADFDSLSRGLEAVTGSAAEASDQFERLRDIARLPAVDLQQAAATSIALQSIGESAEFAERMIKGVANAVALSGGGAAQFEGVVRQLRQVASLGRLMGEELNIILENAPAMGRALQNAFGTTSAEAIRKLNLSTDEFFERLFRGMEDLPQVAGGAANAFDNLRQSMAQAGAALGDQVLPVVVPIVDGLAQMAENLREINPEIIRWGIAIGAVAALVGPLAIALGTMATALTAVGTALGVGAALLVPGGVFLAGLAAFGAWMIKSKLDAAALAGEIENTNDKLRELPLVLAQARLEEVMTRQAEVRALIDSMPATRGTKELRDENNLLLEQYRILVRRVGELQFSTAEVAATTDELGSSLTSGVVPALTAAADEAERLDGVLEAAFRRHPSVEQLQGRDRLANALAGSTDGLDLTLKRTTPRSSGNIQEIVSASGAISQVFGALKVQAASLAASLGPAALAALALKPVLDGLREALAPALAKLTEPLNRIGATIGEQLSPLLEALAKPLDAIARLFVVLTGTLEPLTAIMQATLIRPMEKLGQVLRVIVIAFSYVEQAMGEFVKGLGEFIDNLVPDWLSDAGKGLKEMGQGMIDGAKAARDFSDAVKKAALETSNVPIVFARALRTFQASTGGSTFYPKVPNPNLPGFGGTYGGGPPVQISGNQITVIANNPEEFAKQMENYGARVEWRAGYNPLGALG